MLTINTSPKRQYGTSWGLFNLAGKEQQIVNNPKCTVYDRYPAERGPWNSKHVHVEGKGAVKLTMDSELRKSKRSLFLFTSGTKLTYKDL